MKAWLTVQFAGAEERREKLDNSTCEVVSKLKAGTHVLVTMQLRTCICMRPSVCTLCNYGANLHISSHINNVDCNIMLVYMMQQQ